MLGKKFIFTDVTSKTRSQRLKTSLYSFFNVQRPLDSLVPPAYQLLYLNPKSSEEALSSDGYDSHQAPDESLYKRRMWIGGQMLFKSPIEFNKEVTGVETIQRFRKLKDNHFVDVHREVMQDDQVKVEEQRQFIYTQSLYQEIKPKYSQVKPQYSHELTPTDILLFRYSALTFNSHKIHYNKEYALTEGYPAILVQGPLTVTLLLEWVDTLYDNLKITSFKYKNSSPAFTNERIRLCLAEEEGGFAAWIEGHDGKLLVDAHLTVEC